jgi:hypothetical protein
MAFQSLEKLCCFALPGDSRVASSRSSIAIFPIRRPLYRHFERRDAGLELLDRWALSFLELLEAGCAPSLFHTGIARGTANASGPLPTTGSGSGRPVEPAAALPVSSTQRSLDRDTRRQLRNPTSSRPQSTAISWCSSRDTSNCSSRGRCNRTAYAAAHRPAPARRRHACADRASGSGH